MADNHMDYLPFKIFCINLELFELSVSLIILTFCNLLYHLYINLLDWLMLWYRNRLAAELSECIMAATASWRNHLISAAF